jgi:hypothetical protein
MIPPSASTVPPVAANYRRGRRDHTAPAGLPRLRASSLRAPAAHAARRRCNEPTGSDVRTPRVSGTAELLLSPSGACTATCVPLGARAAPEHRQGRRSHRRGCGRRRRVRTAAGDVTAREGPPCDPLLWCAPARDPACRGREANWFLVSPFLPMRHVSISLRRLFGFRARPRELAAHVFDARPVTEADNPEPAESRVRMVDLPVDLSPQLAKVPIEDTLHLDRDRPALVFVSQFVRVCVPSRSHGSTGRPSPDVMAASSAEKSVLLGGTAQASRRHRPAIARWWASDFRLESQRAVRCWNGPGEPLMLAAAPDGGVSGLLSCAGSLR